MQQRLRRSNAWLILTLIELRSAWTEELLKICRRYCPQMERIGHLGKHESSMFYMHWAAFKWEISFKFADFFPWSRETRSDNLLMSAAHFFCGMLRRHRGYHHPPSRHTFQHKIVSARSFIADKCVFSPAQAISHPSTALPWYEPRAVSPLIELELRGKINKDNKNNVARSETKRLVYKLKVLGQPVTSQVRSSAEKWRNLVIADNFPTDGARAKFQRPACSTRRVERVAMFFISLGWFLGVKNSKNNFRVIWRHWPLMTRWFHDLISSHLSVKWMSVSKSAPQITLESSRTRKSRQRSLTSYDLSWPRLTCVGTDDLWKAWVLLGSGTTCPHSYH